MSVKKMIELYISYGVSEETWKMLYDMTCHNLISQANWKKFFETCKGWYIEGSIIIDSTTEKVVYSAERTGYFEKVA